jgi:hypothetical protein
MRARLSAAASLAGMASAAVGTLAAARPALVQATAGAGVAALPARRAPALPTAGIAWQRLLLMSVGLVVGVVGVLAVVSAAISLVAGGGAASTEASTLMYGPPAELQASSGAAGQLESGLAASQPGAYDLGLEAMAAVEEQHKWDVLRAMAAIEAQRVAQAEAARAASARAATAPGQPTTLGRASGYAVGTVLTARLTIYGCTGPGGGFCGGMASGVRVFEGAAACSNDLPFGTRFRIHGDATGRVYECLDRGHLSSTWVDVFFNNTSEGIRWASNLGGTRVPIEIVN